MIAAPASTVAAIHAFKGEDSPGLPAALGGGRINRAPGEGVDGALPEEQGRAIGVHNPHLPRS